MAVKVGIVFSDSSVLVTGTDHAPQLIQVGGLSSPWGGVAQSEAEAVEDLAGEVLVLELLLAYHLLTLLTAPYKVRHDLLCGSKRQVLEDLEAPTADLTRHLV